MCVMFVYIILQHNQVFDIDIINISTGLYNCVIMLLEKIAQSTRTPNIPVFLFVNNQFFPVYCRLCAFSLKEIKFCSILLLYINTVYFFINGIVYQNLQSNIFDITFHFNNKLECIQKIMLLFVKKTPTYFFFIFTNLNSVVMLFLNLLRDCKYRINKT